MLLIVRAVDAEISVFLEVGFIVALDLSDRLDGLKSLPLTLFRVLCLVEAIYFRTDLLVLDFSLTVDLDMEKFHPTRTLLRVFCQHASDQIL